MALINSLPLFVAVMWLVFLYSNRSPLRDTCPMAGLRDKVVIITGASSGIGAETAVEFAKYGSNVVLVARRVRELEKTADMCNKAGLDRDQILVIPADVMDDDDLKHVIEKTVTRFKHIDVLLNYVSAYSMAKAAQNHLTKLMSLDLAPSGVRVNAVCPGTIKTDIFTISGYADTRTLQEVFDDLASIHPLKRVGTTYEVAKAIVFLASDDASFITGVTLPVDGGRSVTTRSKL